MALHPLVEDFVSEVEKPEGGARENITVCPKWKKGFNTFNLQIRL